MDKAILAYSFLLHQLPKGGITNHITCLSTLDNKETSTSSSEQHGRFYFRRKDGNVNSPNIVRYFNTGIYLFPLGKKSAENGVLQDIFRENQKEMSFCFLK